MQIPDRNEYTSSKVERWLVEIIREMGSLPSLKAICMKTKDRVRVSIEENLFAKEKYVWDNFYY